MNLFVVVIAIVVISAIVGAVAKLLNNLNEQNAIRARQVAPQNGGEAQASGNANTPAVRQSGSDMDRFLAEIDRLRKKTADAPPPPSGQAPAAPVVQPEKRPERPRARVVAELAELPREDRGFAAPQPTQSTGPRAGDLPMASTVAPPSTTAAPATRVTRLASRPRPIAKTPFAKNLTMLLGTTQGLALAIVLQEVLGTAKSKKR